LNNPLSIVIPAYNEERHIQEAIAAVEDSVKPYTSDYEVLVVNDGSQDKTAEIVTRLGQTCPWLRLINNPRNMGMGYSLRAGFQAANVRSR